MGIIPAWRLHGAGITMQKEDFVFTLPVLSVELVRASGIHLLLIVLFFINNGSLQDGGQRPRDCDIAEGGVITSGFGIHFLQSPKFV